MRLISLFAIMAMTASCSTGITVSRQNTTNLFLPEQGAPADAAPGTCWDKTETPALIETVKEQVLISPAVFSDAGTVQTPPVYRTVKRNVIVQERQIRWFQIICDQDMTVDFVAAIQRALALRGFYEGPSNGVLTGETEAAIMAFQKSAFISARDHAALTVEGAQKLGLWVVGVTPKPLADKAAKDS